MDTKVRPVPRLGEAREPAAPVTPPLQERHGRILAAATELGAEKDLKRDMMQAKKADVEVATPYRSGAVPAAAAVLVRGSSAPATRWRRLPPAEAEAELRTASRLLLVPTMASEGLR